MLEESYSSYTAERGPGLFDLGVVRGVVVVDDEARGLERMVCGNAPAGNGEGDEGGVPCGSMDPIDAKT